MIESGDMEKLAAIVLHGSGNKLLGLTSNTPEIQAFLDNVPAYMVRRYRKNYPSGTHVLIFTPQLTGFQNKIRRVHVASREGSLRNLQSALDRRKFSTAKDEISPHGGTPLHVATIFGHTGITICYTFIELLSTFNLGFSSRTHLCLIINQ